MNHDLIKTKNGWECKVCVWQWISKPRTECPGVPRYDWGCYPSHLKTEIDLHKVNLKRKPSTQRSAIIFSMKRGEIDLFDVKDCEPDDPTLSPIYSWDSRGELKTIGELKKENLAPSEEIKPRGAAWVWDKDEEWGKWIPLYHPDDCKWQAKDNWITKTVLKKKYLLSDGWIKRIGEPDKLLKNLHYRNAAPTQLFSRQRVEQFLAENAEEYSKWLDRRDKYLAIFEVNKDKIFERRNLIKEQTIKCLRCASGCSTPQGFLCAIYPTGVKYMPCPDWVERK
ncbi:hypothetical protein G7B40_001340 [Aetokthonos hydrillicola Thurmond2011]|jgi:hypothetical protein|uniref:Uncharacterized protein n=1 Tax=Aetokthonos hydrillicola Thurmond2011 TaxID=2712845 RepID=A0AAP5I3R1_9CYAN|nr:hypothetical protein [Aetokthonos hydrillicola]MBO3463824.1 hypothetical protein [Aetokthonos hydrillicola CCALA 1050]MDR9893229.1 hypothetical protein [Aetokthonos hydrillicola Thurmond2011]